MISARSCAYTPGTFTRELCVNARCPNDCGDCHLFQRTLLRMRPDIAAAAAEEAFQKTEDNVTVRLVLFGGDTLAERGCINAVLDACAAHPERPSRVEAEICLARLDGETLNRIASTGERLTPSVEIRAEWLNDAGWQALDALRGRAILRYCLTPGGVSGFAETLLRLDARGLCPDRIRVHHWQAWDKAARARLTRQWVQLSDGDTALSDALARLLFPPFDIALIARRETCCENDCPAFTGLDCVMGDGERCGCRMLSLFARPATGLTACERADCAYREQCVIGGACMVCAADDPGNLKGLGAGSACAAQATQLKASVRRHAAARPFSVPGKLLARAAEMLKEGGN